MDFKVLQRLKFRHWSLVFSWMCFYVRKIRNQSLVVWPRKLWSSPFSHFLFQIDGQELYWVSMSSGNKAKTFAGLISWHARTQHGVGSHRALDRGALSKVQISNMKIGQGTCMVTDNFLGQKRILIKRKFEVDQNLRPVYLPNCHGSVALIWTFCLEDSALQDSL